MKMKSIFTKLLITIAFISSSSCGKEYIGGDVDCTYYDYSDCNTNEPQYGKATLNFTINSAVNHIVYDVYSGKVDDGTLVFTDTAFESEVNLYLVLGEYSVMAKYIIDGKQTFVIDGGELEKWSEDVCDSTCWHQNELELKLTIK